MREEEVVAAWSDCTDSLLDCLQQAIGSENLKGEVSKGVKIQAIRKLSKTGLGELIIEWLMKEIRSKLENDVVPHFREKLAKVSECQRGDMEAALRECLEYACVVYAGLDELCKSLEAVIGSSVIAGEKPRQKLRLMFDSLIFSNMAEMKTFLSQINRYLERNFQSHHRSWKKQNKQAARMMVTGDEVASDDDDDDDDEDEDDEEEETQEEKLDLNRFGQSITTVGWTGILEDCFTEILYKETENTILKLAKGNFENPLLERVSTWLYKVALPWLRELLGRSDLSEEGKTQVDPTHTPTRPRTRARSRSRTNLPENDPFRQWKSRLEFHVLETFCKMRMEELFDIVTDFPDSTPALHDLKECLARTHQHRELVASLRKAFATRLLHPGANTAQILDVYISSIKALRLLDSTGVLLEAISEPIKEYLRRREDTVRCIVTSLTDDSNSELFEELGRGGDMRPIEHDYDDSDEESEQSSMGEDWTPDPIEADPRKTARSRQSNDILSMLVHIYGSKELFVNEYRLMLADKLLSNLDFDTDREVRNLELLKLRFGESSMHNCEIMVKDVSDSKRINANIALTLKNKASKPCSIQMENQPSSSSANRRMTRNSSRLQSDSETAITSSSSESAGTGKIEVETLDATIVSKQFWPTLHGDNIKLHPIIEERAHAFSHEYSVLKNPRQLVWKTNLGTVQLELEFEDEQTRSFTVSPLLASLILHMAEKDSCTSTVLASEMELEKIVVEKRMAFWVNQGVVQVSSSSSSSVTAQETTYIVVKRLSEEDHQHIAMGDDDRAESAVSADAQLAEEMAIYQSYITGMLNNFESLPLERIQNMLRMFIPSGEHKYDKSIGELGAFLNKLVEEEKLEYHNGQYQLRRL